MAGLTKQQLLFIDKLFENGFNAKQAAIAAKYSERSAESTASRLLSIDKVQEEIERRKNKISERHEITVDDIVQEYAAIAFANISDVVDFKDGNLRVKPDIPKKKLRAIESVAMKESYSETGASSSFRIKNHNKIAALDRLAEYIGMDSGKGNDTKNRSAKSERILGILQAIAERQGGDS